MFCDRCGASVSTGARYCASCGTLVSRGDGVTETVTAPENGELPAPSTPNMSPKPFVWGKYGWEDTDSSVTLSGASSPERDAEVNRWRANWARQSEQQALEARHRRDADTEQPGQFLTGVTTRATFGTKVLLWFLPLFAIWAIWNQMGSVDPQTGAGTVAPGWRTAGVIAALYFTLMVIQGIKERGKNTPQGFLWKYTPKGKFAFYRRRVVPQSQQGDTPQQSSNDGSDLLLGLLAGWFFFGRKH